MTFKYQNMDEWAVPMAATKPLTIVAPNHDTNGLVASVDPSGLSAGDELTLVRNWMPMPMSVYLTETDASGSTLLCTIEITGLDQFGVRQVETLEGSAAGSSTTDGVKIFTYVEKIVLKRIAGAASSDAILVGWSVGNGTKWGLPVKIRKSSTPGVANVSGGDFRDTVKRVFKEGAEVTSGITVNPLYSSIMLASSSMAQDERIQVVLYSGNENE